MSLGSKDTGSLSDRKTLPADSYPSAVAQAVKAFVGPAMKDLNLKRDTEEDAPEGRLKFLKLS
jgi:hypothetical protein